MKLAIISCQRLVGNIRKNTMAQGSKQGFAEQKTLIIEELMERDSHMISKEMLLKKYWMHFNVDQLDQIMLSFDQAKLIVTEVTGNMVIYRMPDDKYQELKKFMEGK